jgi:hypothetical protein
MKRNRLVVMFALVLVTLTIGFASAVAAADQRSFELRTYTAAEGKLDALNTRFREHTIELFKKHGMEVIGFWSPTGEKATPNTLVYLLAYPSQQARETMWKAFTDDPEWKKVYAETQKDGPLVTKVESTMLAPTDYSPMQ